MKKSLLAILAFSLVVGLAGAASAHIGTTVWLIFELSDADKGDIDLQDHSVADWEDVVGDPSFTAANMFADPTVGEGAPYDPSDMDYRFWLAWNNTDSHVYAAMERTDDVFVNEYAGGNLGDTWRHDGSLELMVDGDHTGGDYSNAANPDWTDEEKQLAHNRTAQQFVGIADAPDGRNIGYQGAGTEWFAVPPYADGGGGTVGDAPALSVLEFYVTPGDDIIWNSKADSKLSDLSPGKIIGFQVSIPDFDTAPAEYRAFHTISGQASTWRYADRFVDGRLVGAEGGTTAVEEDSWARIKASFAK